MIEVESLPPPIGHSQNNSSLQSSSCGAGYTIQNATNTGAFWSSIAADRSTLAIYQKQQQQQQQQHYQRHYDQVSSSMLTDDEDILSLPTDASSQLSNRSTPPEHSVVMNVDESLPDVNFSPVVHNPMNSRRICIPNLINERSNLTSLVENTFPLNAFGKAYKNELFEYKLKKSTASNVETCLNEESASSDAQHSRLSSGTMSWGLSSGSEPSMTEYAKHAQPVCFVESKTFKRVRTANEPCNSITCDPALPSPPDCMQAFMLHKSNYVKDLPQEPINCKKSASQSSHSHLQSRKRPFSIDCNNPPLDCEAKHIVDQDVNSEARVFANPRRSARASPRILPCKQPGDPEQGGEYSVLSLIPTLISEKRRKAAFVENLVDTAALILEVIWCNFHINPAAKIIPLRLFLQETLRRSKTSYSTLQTALFYLIRIKPQICSRAFKPQKNEASAQPQRRENNDPATCGRRMFLAALIVASKYLQDRNYSNRAWSKISGLPVDEINQNEIVFLKLIDYNLFIAEDIFKKWSSLLLTHIQAISGSSIENAVGFRQIENQREVERFREALRTIDPITMDYNRNGNYTGIYPISPDISAPTSPREEHDQSDRGLSVNSSPRQMDIDQASKTRDHVVFSRTQKRV